MIIFILLICSGPMLAEASLSTVPSNTSAVVGSTVELHCTSVNGPPTDRILWIEFVTTLGGSTISDGKIILPAHPNYDRYSIVGGERDYHLRIRDVQLSDAGTYTCEDIKSGPPAVFRGYAELVVLATTTTQVTTTTTTTTQATTTSTTTTQAPSRARCRNSTGYWKGSDPDAALCLEVDSEGRVFALWRNDSSPYFVYGYGSADVILRDYKHVGFTMVWPFDQGWVTGYIGECQVCNGQEVILMSGVSRSRAWAPGCGQTGGTVNTKLYTLTRRLPSCRGLELDVSSLQPWMKEKMGVEATAYKN